MPAMPNRPTATAPARGDRSTDARVQARVDTPEAPSVSFAPLDRPVERVQPVSARPDLPAPVGAPDAQARRRPPIVVAGLASAGGQLGLSEYPVQISKVQAPPLREETLARDRLLDWLSVKIHRRAVLLTAEAGYGKTTLLADFSRRTRLRVLWFRLDRGDRDWVGFLAYLVAAVRIHVPDFGPGTSSLLRETATAAPSLDTVLDTFLRELGSLPNEPTAIVFDDFHLVDDAPDVRHVLRELMTRGPERMSFVFASRREPPVRLARLRALGEVAELHTDDLRFSAVETERLFRETYDMRLEPAVLAELGRRTEGWAASLQLVRAALHDRNAAQIRAFISSLSGAEGHLYEYLAEEVVGELPTELQQFLMRTSVLETVDLVLGPVAAEVDAATARALIEEGERNGLFGKSGPNTRHVVRAHPLVRDFLQDRLARSIGADGVRALNLRVAEAAERVDWRTATRHYLAATDCDAAERVLSHSIGIILATGAYSAAQELAHVLPAGGLMGTAGLVLRSRLAQQRADIDEALGLAEQAWVAGPSSSAVLVNLITARGLAGDVRGALEAGRLLEEVDEPSASEIGRVFRRLVETSVAGSLSLALEEVLAFVDARRRRGDVHYVGVALANAAWVQLATGDAAAAVTNADEAISHLTNSSAGVELVSARFARANSLAQLGDIEGARVESSAARQMARAGQDLECFMECGDLEVFFGERARASEMLDAMERPFDTSSDFGEQAVYMRVLIEALRGNVALASSDVTTLRIGEPSLVVAFDARRILALALVHATKGDHDAGSIARQGAELARRQGAALWAAYGDLLAALSDARDPSRAVLDASEHMPACLSMLAEFLSSRLSDITPAALVAVTNEAHRRPWRWRAPIRALLTADRVKDRVAGAVLLEGIGEPEDIPRLRQAARQIRDRTYAGLGHALARRLAPPVVVDDLGRVRVSVGNVTFEGAQVRRKVLALLCLLMSKHRFSSTREEVVEALWPDLDPQAALNSLNQTVYFLRRVFEPVYVEDTSPGYVGQDGETIWLDQELVDGRSRRCLEIIRQVSGAPTPDQALALAHEYGGRFALDFAYEEWASSFRDGLHAGYLRVMEHAIRSDLDTGQFARGTFLAERASEVDPESEEIQAALVRLYRLSGAHAAAAEQYEHYSSTLRGLGVEPPAITDV